MVVVGPAVAGGILIHTSVKLVTGKQVELVKSARILIHTSVKLVTQTTEVFHG